MYAALVQPTFTYAPQQPASIRAFNVPRDGSQSKSSSLDLKHMDDGGQLALLPSPSTAQSSYDSDSETEYREPWVTKCIPALLNPLIIRSLICNICCLANFRIMLALTILQPFPGGNHTLAIQVCFIEMSASSYGLRFSPLKHTLLL